MSEPQVVVIFGEKGGGKSSLAELLQIMLHQSHHDLREVPFARIYGFTRPIKKYIERVLELVKGDRGWRKAIHRVAERLPPNVENLIEDEILAWKPPEERALAEELWLKRWEKIVAERFPDARWIIADDARTEYEFNVAKRRGWFTILVIGRRRHSFPHPDFWLRTERSVRRLARQHRRETAAFRTGRRRADAEACFDFVAENAGELYQLRATIRKLAGWLQELPTLAAIKTLEAAADRARWGETETLTPPLSHGERENDKEKS